MNQLAAKVAYKPVGLIVGAAASALSAAVFRQIWRRIDRGDRALDVRDPTRDWMEVVLGAALQGAIFAGVRAAADRAAAEGVRRATGDWPAREDRPLRVRVRT
jgi:hypothetical protein